MSTTKKFLNILLIGLCLGLTTVNMTSCDSDDIYDLRLENKANESSIEIPEGTTIAIKIESGNGGYGVTSSNDAVAAAEVIDNQLNITGKSIGSAKIVLTDSEGERISLNIEVIINQATVIFPDSEPSAAVNSTGFYVANEDWYGHSNGTVNFFKTDYSIDYRAYRAKNAGKELGVTTEFATIYGDNIYFISKQGNRLVAADAQTLESKAEIKDLGGDGRGFIGISPKKGYVSTNEGLNIFDIENLKVGNPIDGVGADAMDMCLFGNRAFVLSRDNKVYIIDTNTDKLEKTLDKPYNSLTAGKDGNVWLGNDKTLTQLNPYTLKAKDFDISGAPIPAPSWAGAPASSLCASQKENALYWTSENSVAKYDIETGDLNPKFYTLGKDGDVDLAFYGSAIRVEPITDRLILLVKRAGWGVNGSYNWVYIVDNTGKEVKKIVVKGGETDIDGVEKGNYYWFPAIPFFQDVNAPEILVNQIVVEPNKRTAICLSDKIVDADNMSKAIVKSIESANFSSAKFSIEQDSLIITSGSELGTGNIILNANSNGKVVQKEVRIDIRNK